MKLRSASLAVLFFVSGISLAQNTTSPSSASMQIPSSLTECEASQCPPGSQNQGTWSFRGSLGDAHWNNGADAKLIVQKFDADGIVIRRIDLPNSSSFGLTAVYTGKMHGDRIDGSVVWSWSGHWDDRHPTSQWFATVKNARQAAPAASLIKALSSMTECESNQCTRGHQGGCTWAFHGYEGEMNCHNGATAKLVVQKYDADGIVIFRTDLASSFSYGLTAVYTGTLRGNLITGYGTWSWPGHWNNRNPSARWSATLQDSVNPALPPVPPPLISPDVHSDGSVTFHFIDPYSQEILLEMEGAKPIIMQKEDFGVWSITTPPLQPDYYGYDFVDDGITLTDPANPLLLPNLLNPQKKNMVHVPGPSSLPWEEGDQLKGVVHHHRYKSGVVGDQRDFYVYTPPGYDPSAKIEYPVLYLLHGYGQVANSWTDVGFANVILDHLIAEGKAKPMLVVMPDAYGGSEIITGGGKAFWDDSIREKSFNQFTETLLTEVIPQVEGEYRVKKDRNSRAIAGLSMGGAESLLTGLNHLDQFAWIGSFSSGGLKENFDQEFAGLDASANSKLHLLWVACGTDDQLISINRKIREWLNSKSIAHTNIETPGEHTWMVWRRNLDSFAPLLFR
jgi:enterochelin esterase-like enzyme